MNRPLRYLAISIVLSTSALTAHAQTFPAKRVQVIVPYPAGGGLDLFCRSVSERLAKAFNQPVVVENRAGASGTIGAAAVARAAPDGYTLMCGNSSEVSLAPHVMTGVPYEPLRDLTPITLGVRQSVVLVAHPSLGARSAAQLIEQSKVKPVSYGHPGLGTHHNLAIEMFGKLTGAQLVPVAYKGAGGLVGDVVAGHVPLAVLFLAPFVQHIRDKALVPIVVFDATRSAALPEVPTAREVSGKDLTSFGWFGFLGPGKMPVALRDQIDGEVRKALGDPALRERLEGLAMQIVGMPAEPFAETIRKEYADYRRLVADLGFKPQ